MIRKNNSDEEISFNVGNTEIRSESSVKLLGVTMDSCLTFDNHIQKLCIRVSRQINVLSRLAKLLTLDGRKAIYYSFIMSNFSFCPLVWHFCSKANSDKLERLHYRALKFVYQDFDSSYELLLSKNRHSTLNLQRLW